MEAQSCVMTNKYAEGYPGKRYYRGTAFVDVAEELAREIPFYRIRHAVKPGAAGWALVRQGYGASKEDALLKLQYDLYYIKHQSLWLDAVILIKTLADTLTLRGRA